MQQNVSEMRHKEAMSKLRLEKAGQLEKEKEVPWKLLSLHIIRPNNVKRELFTQLMFSSETCRRNSCDKLNSTAKQSIVRMRGLIMKLRLQFRLENGIKISREACRRCIIPKLQRKVLLVLRRGALSKFMPLLSSMYRKV
jgi:hypothetical protein